MLAGLEASKAFKNGVFKNASWIGSVSQDSGKSVVEWYNLKCVNMIK